MADAWEILFNNSSIVIGDAWEHLNAQEGGDIIIGAIVEADSDWLADVGVEYNETAEADVDSVEADIIEILSADAVDILSADVVDIITETEVC